MTTQSDLDIKKYLHLAFNRRFLIIFVAIAVTFAAILFSMVKTNKYQASSTVFIEENLMASLMRGVAVTPSMDAKIRVLSTAMQSRTMLHNVLRELNLDLTARNDAELEKLIEDVRRALNIRIRGRDLFIISFVHENPQQARDFVNTLVRRYVEENIATGRDDTYAAFGFLAEQIEIHRGRLDAADAAVMELRTRKGDLLNRDPGQLLEQIAMAEDRLQELSLRRMEMLSRAAAEDSLMLNQQGVPVQGSVSRLDLLENRLSELLLRYGPAYPEVIRVQAEIQMLEQHLEQNPQGNTTQSTGMSSRPRGANIYTVQAQELRAQEQRVQRQIEYFNELLQNIPLAQAQFAELQHKREEQQKVLSQLMDRYGQAEISRQMELQDKTTSFRIVDPAILPTSPHSPNRLMLIILGMFGGIGLGAGMAFGLDQLDRSVRHVDKLKAMGLPVLAVVPQMENPVLVRRQRIRNLVLYILAGIGVAMIAGVMLLEIFDVPILYNVVQTQLLRPEVDQFVGYLKQLYWTVF
ncbi:MAG: hypothetical protein EA399_11295 [Desulfovibrionales bacterium]|nr:MAG: hypothetical protein EA399_11295 [Desulfovibrionales bacterium]